MFAPWTMALRNLQRRKLQSLLVGAVIALSVLLFFAGFGLLGELRGPFEEMFAEQRGSHFTIAFDTRVYQADEVAAWWRARPDVVAVSPPMAAIELDESSYVRGTEIGNLLFLAERPAAELEQDDLRAVEGSAVGTPRPGEAWVPTSVARDNDIHPGDDLEIPTYDGLRALRVSAVVVDPQYSAPFNNPSRIWVGPGQLARYFPLTSLSRVSLAVRLADPADSDRLWNAFVEHQGGVFDSETTNYAGVVLGYTAPYSLMTAMLIAFSVLSILIALFAIHGTITSSILADFRIIGILRSQGFRPQDVLNIYRMQYFALALVAVPVGIVLGIPLVRTSVALLMSTTGTPPSGSSLGWLALITAALFLGLVAWFVGRVSRRAKLVRPAEAIRFGAAASNDRIAAGPSAARLSRFGVPFIVAIKSLLQQRRRALLLALSIVFATLAASLAVNLDYSFQRGREDPSLLGFDSADVRVTRGGRRFGMRHHELMDAFSKRQDVVAVATSDFIEGILITEDGGPGRDLLGTLVAGDIEALNHRNLEGRNPQNGEEVSIGVATARELGKGIGDTIRLHLRGNELALTVTGIFQSLNNGGTGFRIRLAAIRRADPLYEPTKYGVVLREDVDVDTFIEALEAEYGEAVDAQPGDYFIRNIMDTVVTGMRISNGFLAAVFLLAASFFIFSSTATSIAENRGMFGILKTVGMTPGQLRASVVISVGLVALFGILVGLGLWVFGAPVALSLLFSGLGLVSFPLQNSLLGTLLLVPIILAFCLVSSWLPSARLLDLDPRTLIVE